MRPSHTVNLFLTCFCMFLYVTIFAQDPISFSNPEVGQESRYLFFSGDGFFDSDDFHDFEFGTDTLIKRVVEELGPNKFLIADELSPGSPGNIMINGIDWDSTYNQIWEFQNDSIFIFHTGTSNIFTFFSWPFDNGMAISPLTVNQTFVKGWRSGLSNKAGYANYVFLQGRLYPHLNVVNQNYTATDGPFITQLYNEDYGIIRFLTADPWTNDAWGWVLLPDCESTGFDLGENIEIAHFDTHEFEVPDDYSSYIWQDGSTEHTFTFNSGSYNFGTHRVVAVASDGMGCAWNDSVFVTVTTSTPIQTFKQKDFRLYPTLVTSPTQLTLEGQVILEGDLMVEFYNVQGQLAHSIQLSDSGQPQNNDTRTFSCPHLNDGVYYVYIKSGNKSTLADKIVVSTQ